MAASTTEAPSDPKLLEVGMGYCSEPIIGISADALWGAMLSKVEAPEQFMPVADVHLADIAGGTWRSMTWAGPGPFGRVILEKIFADRSAAEIRFVILESTGGGRETDEEVVNAMLSQGRETDEEVVNAMLSHPLRVEYFKRSVSTKARLHYGAPRAGCVGAIAKTVELASSLVLPPA